MLHKKRVWCIANATDAEALARDLKRAWTLCTGFRLGGYLFLNDSTSEDAVQEYAVVREEDLKQVESITFGWCSLENALQYVQEAVAGKYDGQRVGRSLARTQIQSPEQHGTCSLCA